MFLVTKTTNLIRNKQKGTARLGGWMENNKITKKGFYVIPPGKKDIQGWMS